VKFDALSPPEHVPAGGADDDSGDSASATGARPAAKVGKTLGEFLTHTKRLGELKVPEAILHGLDYATKHESDVKLSSTVVERLLVWTAVSFGNVHVDGIYCKYIAQQLEKRVAFRRTIRMAVQRAQRAGVLGLKIQVSGRLNGAEIARTEWTREGRVPLHTLRADIDYATKLASTTYGVLGIKVWVFKGEILPGQKEPLPVGAAPRRRTNRQPQQFEDRSNKE